MAKNSIHVIPYTFVASADMLGTYQAINPLGLPQACFMLRMNNFTNQILIISYDGVTDHDQIDTRTSLEIYGGEGSSSPQGNAALWAKGQIVYVRGTAGTGAITLVGYYTPVNS